MKRRGGFLKSLGIFILCLTAPAALICTPLIISNFKKAKASKPVFRVYENTVQYSQDNKKTWDTVITLSKLMEECGVSAGTGIKSVVIVPEKTDDTKTTYKFVFSDNTEFEFEVKNGIKGEDGKGIKSIAKDEENSDETQTTYIITFTDDSTFSYEVPNGQDGVAWEITIGNNGNWYINNVDTEVPARGSQGEKGDKGDKGDTGEKGEKGDSSYIYIRYANSKPITLEETFSNQAGAWMGIYAGSKLETELGVDDYNWYNIKGEKGEPGQNVAGGGVTANYIYVRYANVKPENKDQILAEGTGPWMGIYAGSKL